MPNSRILSAKQRRELYESITPDETVIEVVGGKFNGYVGTCINKGSYYSSRVNRINNYFMVTIWHNGNKKQVGCNNIKLYDKNEEKESNMSNRLILKGLFNEEIEVNGVTNMSFQRDEETGLPVATIWVDGKMSKDIPFDDLDELTPMIDDRDEEENK